MHDFVFDFFLFFVLNVNNCDSKCKNIEMSAGIYKFISFFFSFLNVSVHIESIQICVLLCVALLDCFKSIFFHCCIWKMFANSFLSVYKVRSYRKTFISDKIYKCSSIVEEFHWNDPIAKSLEFASFDYETMRKCVKGPKNTKISSENHRLLNFKPLDSIPLGIHFKASNEEWDQKTQTTATIIFLISFPFPHLLNWLQPQYCLQRTKII